MKDFTLHFGVKPSRQRRREKRHERAHLVDAVHRARDAGGGLSRRNKGGDDGAELQADDEGGAGGGEGSFESVAGETAQFESEVTIIGETSSDKLASQTRLRGHGASGAGAVSFQEAEKIRFGERGYSLAFSTVGQGYVADRAEAGLKHRTVTWRVDSSDVQFAGASGLITSNFTISEVGDVTDHHFGLIFVK